ncbi:hypothetical protein N1851_003646 [Merluccius polli]|uniref:Alkylated DNA repair protein AlkB homologue 8 N-terminal domain-containing protein n=1 Tax=Merluccius polli TaxID=89951 RepID=A0AA47N8A3_MERPO|nr:hypothetical protein N1851_003646 [Merluccius polli]
MDLDHDLDGPEETAAKKGNMASGSGNRDNLSILCDALRFFANGSFLYNVGDAEHFNSFTARFDPSARPARPPGVFGSSSSPTPISEHPPLQTPPTDIGRVEQTPSGIPPRPHSTSGANQDRPLSIMKGEVYRSFKRINTRKAAGPDGIPGRVLKACAYQLAEVFTDIFNQSLSLSSVPTCLKTSTIIPIPKQQKVTGLNDWRPIALTPIVSKEEVASLELWCAENHLSLNVKKTKEIVVDFRKKKTEPQPIYINGTAVERVDTFKYLGVNITKDLTWDCHATAVIKKAQQRLYGLRRLKKFGLRPNTIRDFYRGTIESLLTGSFTAWYGSCTDKDRKALRRVVRTANNITGCELPSLEDLYTQRCLNIARRIIEDPTHPHKRLFSPLKSRRVKGYKILSARTSRLRNSFFPQAIRLLNDSAT